METSPIRTMTGAGLLLLVLAATLTMLGRIPVACLPQSQAGGDLLSVLLGDTKKDLSEAMVRRADSYFHGGVDMDCHLEGHTHDHHAAHEHHEAEHEALHEDERRSWDPWQWINARVRAPEVDRHLEGAQNRELLPWFWMAVRSDPHNTEAWTTTWFTAACLMKDAALALRVAEEAVRENPDALDVLCVLGRTYRLEGMKNDVKAESAFRLVRERGLAKSGGHPDRLSAADKVSFLQALDYLSVYAAARSDVPFLRALLSDARTTDPSHSTVGAIAQRLARP